MRDSGWLGPAVQQALLQQRDKPPSESLRRTLAQVVAQAHIRGLRKVHLSGALQPLFPGANPQTLSVRISETWRAIEHHPKSSEFVHAWARGDFDTDGIPSPGKALEDLRNQDSEKPVAALLRAIYTARTALGPKRLRELLDWASEALTDEAPAQEDGNSGDS